MHTRSRKSSKISAPQESNHSRGHPRVLLGTTGDHDWDFLSDCTLPCITRVSKLIWLLALALPDCARERHLRQFLGRFNMARASRSLVSRFSVYHCGIAFQQLVKVLEEHSQLFHR